MSLYNISSGSVDFWRWLRWGGGIVTPPLRLEATASVLNLAGYGVCGLNSGLKRRSLFLYLACAHMGNDDIYVKLLLSYLHHGSGQISLTRMFLWNKFDRSDKKSKRCWHGQGQCTVHCKPYRKYQSKLLTAQFSSYSIHHNVTRKKRTFCLFFFLLLHLLLLAEQLLGKMQCLTGVGKLIKFSQTNFTHSSLGFSLSADISLQVKSDLTDEHACPMSNVIISVRQVDMPY